MIAFASKSLSTAAQGYSCIECNALGILHGLEMFHHSCFLRDICIITNHRPLVAILSKDMATLSQRLQHIMLRLHQTRVYILYTSGPDLCYAITLLTPIGLKQSLLTSQSQDRRLGHAIPACRCRQAIPACSCPIMGQGS